MIFKNKNNKSDNKLVKNKDDSILDPSIQQGFSLLEKSMLDKNADLISEESKIKIKKALTKEETDKLIILDQKKNIYFNSMLDKILYEYSLFYPIIVKASSDLFKNQSRMTDEQIEHRMNELFEICKRFHEQLNIFLSLNKKAIPNNRLKFYNELANPLNDLFVFTEKFQPLMTNTSKKSYTELAIQWKKFDKSKNTIFKLLAKIDSQKEHHHEN